MEQTALTEKQAEKLTKYFGAGVAASIWCYAGSGDWKITITQDNRLTFYGIDGLKRELLNLWQRVATQADLELLPEKTDVHTEPITFHSLKAAIDAVEELGKAVAYIREFSNDDRWRDVPADIFLRFREEH